MRKIISLLIMLLLAAGHVSAANTAKKKAAHKKISKTYVNVPLQDVLTDIGKRADYTLDYDEAELDLMQPVNAKFMETSAVAALKKILGKQYLVKANKERITITALPVPPTVYQAVATLPVSVAEDEERIVSTYRDTTFSVSCKTVTRLVPANSVTAPEPTAKGHYVQAMLGLGYGSMGYTLTGDRNATTEAGKVGTNTGSLQGLLQVQYAYYFHENWGVNVGLALSGYGSCGVLNTTARWNGQGDTDGERKTSCPETFDNLERSADHNPGDRPRQVVARRTCQVGTHLRVIVSTYDDDTFTADKYWIP